MAKKDSVIKTAVEAIKPAINVAPAPTQMSSAPKTTVQENPASVVANKKKWSISQILNFIFFINLRKHEPQIILT